MGENENLQQYMEHLNMIKAALEKQDAYLFVGAGLSRNAVPKASDVKSEFKTWTAFIEQLGKKLWPSLSNEELSQKIAGQHLLIAQLYEEEFGRSAFYEELLKAVPYKEYVPSKIHKELIGLEGWKGFITTNQDCLIEQTLDELHVHHDVIITDLDVATKPAKTKVFKLHGSMERPESIIFTEEQYRTYAQKHRLLHIKVKSIFAEHLVVFVGFGLTDPNFKEIYGWVKDILQTNYQRKAYAFVFKKDIDPYTKKYWEKRNIILLPIQTLGIKNLEKGFTKGMMRYIDFFKQTKKETIDNEIVPKLHQLLDEMDWNQTKLNQLLYCR